MIENVEKRIQGFEGTLTQNVAAVGGVKLSLIVMVVWVIVVTVALVVIGILSFRKWRRDYFLDARSSGTGSESQSSAGDYSDLGSSLNDMMETASTSGVPPDDVGEYNGGFVPDAALSPASVSLDIEEDLNTNNSLTDTSPGGSSSLSCGVHNNIPSSSSSSSSVSIDSADSAPTSSRL